jgi:hypothetical protein
MDINEMRQECGLGSSTSEKHQIAGSYDQGNEPSGYIK